MIHKTIKLNIAVKDGVFGLIWREETGDDRVGIATIGIAIFAFLASFVLADNTLVGHEKMPAIFIKPHSCRCFRLGLTTVKNKSS